MNCINRYAKIFLIYLRNCCPKNYCLLRKRKKGQAERIVTNYLIYYAFKFICLSVPAACSPKDNKRKKGQAADFRHFLIFNKIRQQKQE